MTYSYACPTGHTFELQREIGTAPSETRCVGLNNSCSNKAFRDFAADFAGVTFAPIDPFRSYDLSSAKARAEGDQQRHIDAPRDSFERKHLEKILGRTYIGNDTSVLRKQAQDGIKMYQESKS